jgi:cell division protein FtsW (lipid II flippase)
MSEPVTTADMLIGSALLLILFALFAIGFGAIGLAIYALELTTKRFFPELASHWQIAYYGFLCLMFLLAAVRHIRQRHRLSTFLSLAGSAAMLSVLFANPHLRFGANTFCLLSFRSSVSRPTLKLLGPVFSSPHLASACSLR